MAEEVVVTEAFENQPEIVCCKSNKKKRIIIAAIIVMAVLAALYFFRSFFVVALVNGKPITRWALDRELEKQGGRQILNTQIAEVLIKQEAKKQKVAVTAEDINQKLNEIDQQLKAQGQGQGLDTTLTAQGLTRAEFAKQMETEVLLQKLLGKDIQITDEEIEAYFKENKDFFGKDDTLEDQKENIRLTIFQQKMGEKFQPWLQTLQAQAKIIYFLKF